MLELEKDILMKSPFLREFQEEEIQKIISVAKVGIYKEGDVLFDCDTDIRTLYILVEGDIQFVVPLGNREIEIHRASVGDIFGLSSILPSDYKTTFKALVVQDAQVIEFGIEELERVFKGAPFLRYRFYFNLLKIFTLKKDKGNHLLLESLLNLPPVRKYV